MSGAYVVRITPADVGRRVSVRARLAAVPGQPTTTDTVGRLLEWTDQTLTIEKRDGSRATVAAEDMLAAKVIPETPSRGPRSTLPPEHSVEDP